MSVIYIVEDDSNIREIEMIALRNSGHQVYGFETGKELYRDSVRGVKQEIL